MSSRPDSSGLQPLHGEYFLALVSLEAITGNDVVMVRPNQSFHQPDMAKISKRPNVFFLVAYPQSVCTNISFSVIVFDLKHQLISSAGKSLCGH